MRVTLGTPQETVGDRIFDGTRVVRQCTYMALAEVNRRTKGLELRCSLENLLASTLQGVLERKYGGQLPYDQSESPFISSHLTYLVVVHMMNPLVEIAAIRMAFGCLDITIAALGLYCTIMFSVTASSKTTSVGTKSSFALTVAASHKASGQSVSGPFSGFQMLQDL